MKMFRETTSGPFTASASPQEDGMRGFMQSPLPSAQLDELYRTVFHHFPECLFVLDENLRIVLCNWQGRLANVPDEIRRRHPRCYEIFDPEQDGPCPDCPVQEVLRTGKPTVRRKCRQRTGHIEMRAFPLPCDNRRFVLLSEQTGEITSAKQLEEQLTASEKKLQILFDLLPQTIFEIDRDGNIVFANPAGFEAFAYAPKDLAIPLHVTQMVIHEQRPRVTEVLQRVVAGENLRGHEFTAQRKDGGTFPAMVFVDPIFNPGVVVGAVGMLVDLSDYKTLEEQLIQSQKMETVARMAQGLAHDFNNLLMIVNGYSQQLLEVLENPAQRNWARAIQEAGDRAAALTMQLQNLGRGTTGDLSPLDLNAVLVSLASLVRNALGRSNTLTLRLAPQLRSTLANQDQIEQVVMNLAVNARDAMPDGGRLTITTANVVGAVGGPKVKLTVQDTGCGMDESVRAHIFDPFFTTKEKGKGTGLGLSTVYTIIKNHGGTIEVDSAPNQGATITIHLPCQEAPPRK
jgi:two-component system cell cycle sensor histidine kinase/response regulator CckA